VSNFVPFLGALTKLQKAAISFVMSVGPPAWNNSDPNGRIFVTFDIGTFFKTICKENEIFIQFGEE